MKNNILFISYNHGFYLFTMKLYKILVLFFSFIPLFNANGAVKLSTPYDLEIKQLNEEEKDKLKSINFSETVGMPKQYKGKLNNTEGVEEVRLKDVGAYFGAGGRYSVAKKTDMEADANVNTLYYNKNEKWEFDNNFNFFVSAGLYWRNGIRIEFEYSEATFENSNFGKNFEKVGPYVFNQYLQTEARIRTETSGGTTTIYLTNNDFPLVEFSVKTYMLNFIFEKTNIKSPIKPYVAFGVGMVSGDMANLRTDDVSNVPGAQIMVGLSYPISDGAAAIYLGYRGVFAKEMEQTFTRVVDADTFDGTTYVNPIFVKTKQKYDYQSQNIDFGVKFFF